jgi:hypothetical protein
MTTRREVEEMKTSQVCLFIAYYMYEQAGMRNSNHFKILDEALNVLTPPKMGVRAAQALKAIRLGNVLTPKGIQDAVDYALALVVLENSYKKEAVTR